MNLFETLITILRRLVTACSSGYQVVQLAPGESIENNIVAHSLGKRDVKIFSELLAADGSMLTEVSDGIAQFLVDPEHDGEIRARLRVTLVVGFSAALGLAAGEVFDVIQKGLMGKPIVLVGQDEVISYDLRGEIACLSHNHKSVVSWGVDHFQADFEIVLKAFKG
jgi:Fe2+ transport system protein FeoA